MEPAWTSTALLVPCAVVLMAGLVYLHAAVVSLLSGAPVRNKVLVMTDALSGLGKGERQQMICKTPIRASLLMSSAGLWVKNVQVCFTKEEPG